MIPNIIIYIIPHSRGFYKCFGEKNKKTNSLHDIFHNLFIYLVAMILSFSSLYFKFCRMLQILQE